MDSASTIPLCYYLILIFFLLIGGAYFAAAETSFSKVSRIRMISDADDGDKKAKRVLYILDRSDEALTTVLIGNNIMHIACSSVATLFASKLWGNAGVTIATFIITFIVFIFAEMIPKSYAMDCPEKLAPALSGSLYVLMTVLKPLEIIFSCITGLIAKLFPASGDADLTITEEELFDIIENIDETDDIDEDEAELVQSALEFTQRTAADILIPWEKVVRINRSMSDDAILKIIEDNHFSRLPVVDDNGEIEGILQIKKFLKAKIRGRKVLKSKSMLDKVFYIKSSMPIDDILPELSSHRVHMAFVKDENNRLAGIITIEDILEELVGEIYDEEEAAS